MECAHLGLRVRLRFLHLAAGFAHRRSLRLSAWQWWQVSTLIRCRRDVLPKLGFLLQQLVRFTLGLDGGLTSCGDSFQVCRLVFQSFIHLPEARHLRFIRRHGRPESLGLLGLLFAEPGVPVSHQHLKGDKGEREAARRAGTQAERGGE